METNPVRRAKDVLGGTLEDLARAAGVTVQAASKWQLIGRIPMAEYAYRVWRATLAKGDEVTVPELAGFDPASPFPTGTDPEATTTSRRRLYAASSKAEPEKEPTTPAVASLHGARKKKACRPSRRWWASRFRSSAPVSPDSTPLPATGTEG